MRNRSWGEPIVLAHIRVDMYMCGRCLFTDHLTISSVDLRCYVYAGLTCRVGKFTVSGIKCNARLEFRRCKLIFRFVLRRVAIL